MSNSKLYISIRKTRPQAAIERGLEYFSRVNGSDGLLYDAECALSYLGEEIGKSPIGQRIIFINHLSESDELGKCLDMLVNSHNILGALQNGDNLQARRVLANKRV